MQSYSKRIIWPSSTAQFPSTKIAAEHLKHTSSSRRWKLKDGSKRLHKGFFHHPMAFCGGLQIWTRLINHCQSQQIPCKEGTWFSCILSGLAHHIFTEFSKWKCHRSVSPLWAWSPPRTTLQHLILPSLMVWSSSGTTASRTLSQEGSHSNKFSHSRHLVTPSQVGQLSGVLRQHFL